MSNNKIDVSNLNEKKEEIIYNGLREDLNEYYENNYEYKVSLVNVDSRFRNKIPKNIIDSSPIFLEENSLYVTENSNKIKVYYKNHSFNVGDRIIVKNVKSNKIMLRNSIFLYNGFSYFLLKIDNHGLKKSYLDNIEEFKIKITIDDNINNNDRLIGNIPLNSLTGIHNIYLLDENTDENISDDIVDKILNILEISRLSLIENYIFIKLPFFYSNENKLNNDLIYEEYQSLNKIINIEYLNIGGIPLSYINSDYPINSSQYQSSQEIIEIEPDYFYFNINKFAIYTDQNGGNNIYIGKIINTIEGYPDANNYTIDLKKSFTNIVRMELVTSEIPYIDFNIKSNINNSNNKIYWKYLEDGNVIYNTKIPEGNYTPSNLIIKLKEEMNKIKRISSTNENEVYSIFDISFDTNSQMVKFLSFKRNLLPNSLSIEKDINLGSNVLKLNIKQANNFLNIGDEITISNSNKIGDVIASVINTTHTVYSINGENDTYTVLITIDTEKNFEDINVDGTGGPNIKIQIPAKVSLLFNYNDTLGSILGFKNVGNENAITPYKQSITNFDEYIEPIIYDEVGNTNPSNSLINLNGNNYYVLLYLNDFENIYTNQDFDNAFSKLLLVGNPGDIMFNTFVNSPLEFDNPVPSLEQLKVSFLFPDGTRPDFRNFDHSFTLRIVEKITKPYKTLINPNKTTYNNSLIDIYSK
jgi:7-cyano-7-deazaguanine synthase in queuosine biosynthesis